jgi:hypothetical protein
LRFFEKLVWILTAVVMALLVLVMVYWKPSPIPTSAIRTEKLSPEKTTPDSGRRDFSTVRGSGSGRHSSGSTGRSSRSRTAKPASSAIKLPYPTVRSKNPKYSGWKLNREFRDKYGDNYREVYDALQQAEAVVVEKPDGSKAIRIVSIDKNSIINKLHFEVGDEIFAVNGRDFKDFEGSTGDLYSYGKGFYDDLKTETEFQIEIERGGIPTVLYFRVPK